MSNEDILAPPPLAPELASGKWKVRVIDAQGNITHETISGKQVWSMQNRRVMVEFIRKMMEFQVKINGEDIEFEQSIVANEQDNENGFESGPKKILQDHFLEYLKEGQNDQHFRRKLAWKAFQHVAAYDSAVSEWLWKQTEGKEKFPPSFIVPLSQKSSLRYGENPHQKAAFYVDKSLAEVNAGGIATAIQHHKKVEKKESGTLRRKNR